jgi:hypothetical protein
MKKYALTTPGIYNYPWANPENHDFTSNGTHTM